MLQYFSPQGRSTCRDPRLVSVLLPPKKLPVRYNKNFEIEYRIIWGFLYPKSRFHLTSRKVLLLLDGFSSHHAVFSSLNRVELTHVRVEFLHANTNYVCQPQR